MLWNEPDYLMAPSTTVLNTVVAKLEEFMERKEGDKGDEMAPAETSEREEHDIYVEPTLIEFPVDGSAMRIVMHVFLYPLKFLMHFTVPDVRIASVDGDSEASICSAFLAVIACLLWLVVGSYAMVASMESLAALMDIPELVVGFTVSAAGTSLPNYVASKVAAEQGFGDMAVSNAFGSNTFNIMIGLGLPWTLYIAFVNGFQPYHGLPDDGILESVLILATVLLVFVVIVLTNNFVLVKWHAYLFMVLYVAYIAFAVGQVYW